MMALRTVSSTERITRHDIRRRQVPNEPMPSSRPQAPFSLEDRFQLARLLAMRAEYVDSPFFHLPGAEEALFGNRAELPENATHFAGSEFPMKSERKPGRSAVLRLFLQFNYARMRQQELLDQLSDGDTRPDELRLILAWARRAMELRRRIVKSKLYARRIS